jgi:cytochrome c oxidase subunit 4
MEHTHITPPKVYLIVYVVLVVLMGATIYASFWHLGRVNNIIAMGIAVSKAALVVLFFMQVKYSSRLTWLWAGIGFVWLLFLFGTVGDYMTRNWLPVTGWEK